VWQIGNYLHMIKPELRDPQTEGDAPGEVEPAGYLPLESWLQIICKKLSPVL
jgi:hypothetical protein